MARLAIVVMILNSDAHVVAPYVMGDLIINTYRDKHGQTWELQVFRDINNSLCGTNSARTDFFRNTAGESLDSESLLQSNILSD